MIGLFWRFVEIYDDDDVGVVWRCLEGSRGGRRIFFCASGAPFYIPPVGVLVVPIVPIVSSLVCFWNIKPNEPNELYLKSSRTPAAY